MVRVLLGLHLFIKVCTRLKLWLIVDWFSQALGLIDLSKIVTSYCEIVKVASSKPEIRVALIRHSRLGILRLVWLSALLLVLKLYRHLQHLLLLRLHLLHSLMGILVGLLVYLLVTLDKRCPLLLHHEVIQKASKLISFHFSFKRYFFLGLYNLLWHLRYLIKEFRWSRWRRPLLLLFNQSILRIFFHFGHTEVQKLIVIFIGVIGVLGRKWFKGHHRLLRIVLFITHCFLISFCCTLLRLLLVFSGVTASS